MDRIESEIEHSKRIAPHAEEIWGWLTKVGKLRAQRRADLIAQWGRFKSTDRILEIGCGTGLFTEKISHSTRALILAVDISEDLLEIAQKRGLSRVTFQAGNAMVLKFVDGEFDGVFGSSILHHLDMEQGLREVFRVLKQGGRAVFSEPNMLNPQILIQKNIPFVKKHLGDSPDETAVIRWKLAKRMRRIGFQAVTIFPYDFLHPTTPPPWIGTVQKLGAILEKIPIFKEIAGSVMIIGEK